ncbi:MAG: Histone-lysine N-methyltransferase setd1b [Marteilia pararefringens]
MSDFDAQSNTKTEMISKALRSSANHNTISDPNFELRHKNSKFSKPLQKSWKLIADPSLGDDDKIYRIEGFIAGLHDISHHLFIEFENLDSTFNCLFALNKTKIKGYQIKCFPLELNQNSNSNTWVSSTHLYQICDVHEEIATEETFDANLNCFSTFFGSSPTLNSKFDLWDDLSHRIESSTPLIQNTSVVCELHKISDNNTEDETKQTTAESTTHSSINTVKNVDQIEKEKIDGQIESEVDFHDLPCVLSNFLVQITKICQSKINSIIIFPTIREKIFDTLKNYENNKTNEQFSIQTDIARLPSFFENNVPDEYDRKLAARITESIEQSEEIDNGFNEKIYSKLKKRRDEILTKKQPKFRTDAIAARDYNSIEPQSKIKHSTRLEYRRQLKSKNLPKCIENLLNTSFENESSSSDSTELPGHNLYSLDSSDEDSNYISDSHYKQQAKSSRERSTKKKKPKNRKKQFSNKDSNHSQLNSKQKASNANKYSDILSDGLDNICVKDRFDYFVDNLDEEDNYLILELLKSKCLMNILKYNKTSFDIPEILIKKYDLLERKKLNDQQKDILMHNIKNLIGVNNILNTKNDELNRIGLDRIPKSYQRDQRLSFRKIASLSDLSIKNKKNIQTKDNLLRFAESSIDSLGLFALEYISENEILIEYSGEIIRLSVADIREEKEFKKYSQNAGSYFFKLDDIFVIDATYISNNARFINHSCNPNAQSKVITVDGIKRAILVSKRAIEPGEEISFDYKFPYEEFKIPCKCGSSNCRKYLN